MYYQDPVLAYYEAELARLRGELEQEYYTPVDGAPPQEGGYGETIGQITDAASTAKDVYDVADAAGFLGGSEALASTAAQNVAWNAGAAAAAEAGSAGMTSLATTAAQNAAWNAGADMATVAAAETASGGAAASGLGSYAASAWPLLALYGAYRAYGKLEGARDAARNTGLTAEEQWNNVRPGAMKSLQKKLGINDTLGTVWENTPGGWITQALYGSGKSDDQLYRDRIRKDLQSVGALDRDYQIKLADGSTFDMGLDGGHRVKSTDGTERSLRQIDWQAPDANRAVNLANPLGYIAGLGVEDKDISTDWVGYFTNAATSSGGDYETTKKNIRSFYDQMQLDREGARQGVDLALERGNIDEATKQVFYGSIDEVFGPEATQQAPRSPATSVAKEESPTVQKPKIKKRKPYKLTMPEAPEVGPASVYGNRTTEDYQEMLRQFGGPYYGQNGA